MKRRVLLAILSLLGFATACKEEMVEMYDTPRADFRVRGRVTDPDGQPVPGIEVSNRFDEKKVLSNADGHYDLSGGGPVKRN